ncbi:MAG: hypothetical protein EOP51_08285 [Sphingobacteriales bacterium]|nr:MAG: hypothetical protein EOP51_08285 [Sphingobacteriales bacterium]
MNIRQFNFSKLLTLAAAILLAGGVNSAYAQANVEVFGQNRIQYRKFDWKFFDTKHFRIYHYDAAGRQLARYVSEQVENDVAVVEKKLGGDFPHLNIVVYNSYDEYRQTNIGRKYDSQLQDIPAGTVDIVGDKLVVYFTGVHTDLRRQTRAGMSRAIMERLLFGENFREMVKNALLMNLPNWTVNGFISYIVDGWDAKSNTTWRNLIEANPTNGFYELAEKQPELAGKAFWKYIADKYGENNMKNLLYSMQMKASLQQGVKMSLGQTVKQAYDSTLSYYGQMYALDDTKEDVPNEKTALIEINVPKDPATTIRTIKVAPKGNDIAYVQWKNGEFTVYVQKTKDQKSRSAILSGGRLDYNESADPDYPLLAWSNNGYKLGVIYKKGPQTKLRIYNSLKGKIENINIPQNRFDRVLSMSFMEDDDRLMLSAIKKSQTDLYEMRIRGSRMTNITNDAWDDVQPWYVSGGSRKGILFLSNRTKPSLDVPIGVNELPTGPMNVFFYNTKTQRRELIQMSDISTGTITQPIQYGSDNYAYLYDANGVQNKYVVLLGRDVNNMDSAYSVPITNYNHNIVSHQYNPSSNQVADVVQVGDKLQVYFEELKIPGINATAKELQPSTLMQTELNKRAYVPSMPTSLDNYGTGLPGSVQPITEVNTSKPVQGGNVFQSEFDEPSSATAPAITDGNTSVVNSSSALSNTGNTTDSAGKFVFANSEFEPIENRDKPVQTLPEVTEDSVKTKKGKLAKLEQQAPAVVDSAYLKMKAQPYRLSFRPDFFTVRLDNTVLFNKYQSVQQNGGRYNNPDLGGMITVGLDDAMENHRFTGGFRLPLNFSGNTYFLQYENFKRRVDWALLFLRTSNMTSSVVTFVDSANNPVAQQEVILKTNTNYLQGTVSYPFDRVRSVRMHLGLRQDQLNLRAENALGLANPEKPNQYWVNSRVEYIFDNTVRPALNIYNGFRYKFFAEYMYQLNGDVGGFYNLGLDFRYYKKLYKNVIWANRLAGAHSAGDQKILYNLGGVDNWMMPKYSEYVPVRPTENYAFQALATNLRGYEQNSRNGNTYAVYNTEIRVPVFSTFIKKPIQSAFIRNFQAIAFVDAGSAWNGLVPNADALRNDRILYDPSLSPVQLTITDETGGIGVGYGAGARTNVFGYFLRLDAAWNIEGRTKPIWYFSIGTDF